MGVCNCSMFCCTLLYVHSSIAIILMGKRELIALLNLSSWCLVVVERLFLAVPRVCLQFVIVVFPDHTHLLFFHENWYINHVLYWNQKTLLRICLQDIWPLCGPLRRTGLGNLCSMFQVLSIYYTPASFVYGGYTVFTLSIRPCVRP